VLFVAAWRGLPATRPVPPAAALVGCHAGAYARLAREPVFLLYVAILALTTGTFYTFLAGAPLVLGSYGVGPDGVGFYIMCVRCPTSAATTSPAAWCAAWATAR
jgi:DHA1 family bicyclomycin/chloramphenicol resistance-like MFS transporter